MNSKFETIVNRILFDDKSYMQENEMDLIEWCEVNLEANEYWLFNGDDEEVAENNAKFLEYIKEM